MKVSVRITNSFKIAAKPLFKKYRSLGQDLTFLEKELLLNPRLGNPLGNDAYKIRLKISSKQKGKSGGAGVISLVEANIVGISQVILNEEIVVNLITIFDKSDVSNITDKELKDLIKKNRN